MGSVGVVAWSGLRHRWRALVALTILLALTGAVVLAAVAGSRRARTALDGFLAYDHPGRIQAYVDPSLPVEEQEALLDDMTDAAGDVPSYQYALLIVALPNQDITVGQAIIDGPALSELSRPIVVDGDLPLGPGEAAVNEALAERQGVQVGDDLDLSVFAQDQIDVIGNGDLPPPQSTVPVRVGAVIRLPLDLARSPEAQEGTLYEAQDSRLVLDPTFWAEHGPDLATYGEGLVVDPPPGDVDRVARAMRRAGGVHTLVQAGSTEDLERIAPVADAIDLEANALLAFGALVLVFGLGLLGTAVARVTGEDEDDHRTLVALGLAPRDVLAARLLRAAAVAVTAAAGAVVLAVPASALFPIGLAGDAEVDRGVEVDGAVLAVGAVAFAALVLGRLALSEITERRGRRTRSHRRWAPAVGPVVGLGVFQAVDGLTTRGGRATRAAMATAVVGIVAVAGAATFATSLHRLTSSPDLQGFTWDLTVGNYSDPATAEADRPLLADDPDVDAFVGYNYQSFSVDGRAVTLAELDDGNAEILPVVLEGRAPRGDGEVALGRGTLADLGKSIGDRVEVALDRESVSAEVVGAVVAPAVIAPSMDLDSGGVVTFALVQRLTGGRAAIAAPEGYLVRLDADADHAAARARLFDEFGGTVLGPTQPLDLGDLQRVEDFPYALAAMLGILALGSVALSLVASTRRRRRDLAVVRGFGLDRGQVRRLLAAEATTFTLAALVFGVPLGIVAGRLAWRLAADGIGTEVGPVTPLLVVTTACLAVVLLVNAYGQWLATVLGHRSPASDLRAE